MNAQEVLNTLKQYRFLKTREETQQFMHALQQLEGYQDRLLLQELFLLFDDNVVNINPLQALRRHIEQYDIEAMVQVLMDVTPAMQEYARDWMMEFYARLLHRAEDVNAVRAAFQKLQADQHAAVQMVLEAIPHQDYFEPEDVAYFEDKVRQVLRA